MMMVGFAITGHRLGRYRILERIGAGGMGVVYHARDERLNRDVAVKVLPAGTLATASARSRFRQEALILSRLNHPNIATIHDFDAQDGLDFLVMEFVGGETLDVRLAAGAVSEKNIVPLGSQLAQGLSAAHEQNIVHCDLKPANVRVLPDGRLKILDFGLATLLLAASGTQVTQSIAEPRLAGTLPYMAPEQLRGEKPDERADIYAAGMVLYEMTTGRRAFPENATALLVDAVLHKLPLPPHTVKPQVPRELERIIVKAIDKDPDQRYQSARDMQVDLERLARPPVLTVETAATKSWAFCRAQGHLARQVIVIMMMLGLLGGALVWRNRRAELSIPPLTGADLHRLTFERGNVYGASFLPDGETFIYEASWNGKPAQLYMSRLGSSESRPLTIPNAHLIGISRTGELALGLAREVPAITVTLAVMPFTGNMPQELLDNIQGADWSPDGQFLAVIHCGGSCRLEYPLGKVIYEPSGSSWISNPRVSPNGDRIAFFEHPVPGNDTGAVVTVDLAGHKTIISDGWVGLSNLVWDPVRDLLWVSGGEPGAMNPPYALYALAVPSGKIKISLHEPDFVTVRDISRDGRKLLLTREVVRSQVVDHSQASNDRDLSWQDLSVATALAQDGNAVLLLEQGQGARHRFEALLRRTDGSPPIYLGQGVPTALSADAKQVLAFDPTSAPPQLWSLPVGLGERHQLTHDNIAHDFAVWLPYGKGILFQGSEPGRPMRSWVQDLAGGPPRAITPEGTFGVHLSPDGTRVVVADAERRFFLYPIGAGAPQRLPQIEPEEQIASWSADGQFIYFFAGLHQSVLKLFRLNVSIGKREFLYSISPRDVTGVHILEPLLLSGDAKSYIYSYVSVRNDLYVIRLK